MNNSTDILENDMNQPVTRRDLEETLDRKFKEHKEFDALQHDTMKSMLLTHKAMHDKHEEVLFGRDGRNGLVRDVNDINSAGSVFKWLATVGGGSGIAALIRSLF